jgi:hypothetical protein
MKHVGIIVCLLIIVSTAAGGQNKPPVKSSPTPPIDRRRLPEQTKPSVDRTTQRSPEQGQRAEQRGREIIAIVNDLPAELASRTQRRQFASIINLLLAKRMVQNVRGYEQEIRFQKEFAANYEEFLKTLESGTPIIKQGEIEEFANISMKAFEKNEEQFQSFYEKAIKTDPQLSAMSMPEVAKKLLQFSAWLYINDRKRWLGFWRITFIWPWCYGR